MERGGGRVDWVDVAKGICIVFVVMMHSTLGIELAAKETGWMGHVVAFAQPFRMPDFFLISGLFLGRVIVKDWRTFLDRRVVHFFYFYLIWLTIQFAFKAPQFVAAEGVEATVRLYLVSLFVEPFGTLWFIWILPLFALMVRALRDVPVWVVLPLAGLAEALPVQTMVTVIDETANRFVYFYAGCVLAPAIFRFAERVGERPLAGLAGLGLWAVVNGAFVFAGWATMPGVSLALGAAGALAIVTSAVLLARSASLGSVPRFLGENSIAVYLGFFLPMACTRFVLLRTDVITDVGTMSLLVTIAAVVGALMMWWVAMRLGFRFLYERPAWARLEHRRQGPALAAAE